MEVKKTSCGGFSFFKTSVLHSFIPAHLSPMNIDARACRFQISNNPLLLTYFAALCDRTHMQTQTSAHACTTGYVNNKDCIWKTQKTLACKNVSTQTELYCYNIVIICHSLYMVCWLKIYNQDKLKHPRNLIVQACVSTVFSFLQLAVTT